VAVSVVRFGTLLEADAPMNPAAALREAVDCVVTVADLVPVGTDPETDGAVEAAGGRFLHASGRPLAAVAADQEVVP
jgi:hypothetical protein